MNATKQQVVSKDEKPTDAIHAEYLDVCKEKLRGVHSEAYNIMRTVYWGEISKEKMSEELTYRSRGVIVFEQDIDLIIDVSLFLLKARMHKKVNQDDISVIINKYPDLIEDVHSIGLKPLEASALESMGVPLVCYLYKQEITCEELDKGRQYKLSAIVNGSLRKLGFPALVKSGKNPVGPFCAFYRAIKYQQTFGRFDE